MQNMLEYSSFRRKNEEALCFYYDLSYEQLLVKLAKEKAESIVEG